MDTLRSLLDGASSYWENLTDRERLLLGLLGGVAAALLVLVPVFLLTSAIGDLEEENTEITTALRRISSARGQLAAQQAIRLANEQRYNRRAPSLGSFLEAKAGELEGLTISDVQHEPEREQGQFRIRHSRARFQNTGLRNAMLLLQNIENARYPVAIERVHIDHNSSGDRYNLQIGVLAFDREGSDADAGTPRAAAGSAARGSGRTKAGPPAP